MDDRDASPALLRVGRRCRIAEKLANLPQLSNLRIERANDFRNFHASSIAAEAQRLQWQFPVLACDLGFSHEFRAVVADVADFGIGFVHVHVVGVDRRSKSRRPWRVSLWGRYQRT